MEKIYLHVETVNGIELTNATFRTGPDRRKPRASANVTESMMNRFRTTTKQVVAAAGCAARPSMVEIVPHLEKATMMRQILSRSGQCTTLQDWPAALDPNLVNGHPSIARHTDRWHAASYFIGRDASPDFLPPTIYKEERGPYIYFVMSAFKSESSRSSPPAISADDGKFAIDLITLRPQADRHESWLLKHGFLKFDEGHVRICWGAWSDFYEKYAVVRVDPRLITDKTSNEAWLLATVCKTADDEAINFHVCEHCATARYIMGDPQANIEATPLTAEVDAGGRPVLEPKSICRDRDGSPAARKRCRTTTSALVDGSPPRADGDDAKSDIFRHLYTRLLDLSNVLRRPQPNKAVQVAQLDGKQIGLLDGAAATAALRHLRLQLDHIRIQWHCEWRWETVSTNLRLQQLFDVYRKHPNAIVSAAAIAATEALERGLHVFRNGRKMPNQQHGEGRTLGQTSYSTIHVPLPVLAAAKSWYNEHEVGGSMHKYESLWLLGRKSAGITQPVPRRDIPECCICFGGHGETERE